MGVESGVQGDGDGERAGKWEGDGKLGNRMLRDWQRRGDDS